MPAVPGWMFLKQVRSKSVFSVSQAFGKDGSTIDRSSFVQAAEEYTTSPGLRYSSKAFLSLKRH